MEDIYNDKNQKHGFTGIWIPVEILKDERLNLIDKMFYGLLVYAIESGIENPNDFVMGKLRIGKRSFKYIITKLENLCII